MTNDKNNKDQKEDSNSQVGITEIQLAFPVDPLEHVAVNEAMRRSMVAGILESYHGNYDILAELVQNSMDALEDAYLVKLEMPYKITVHINLRENWVSVLDTGLGMSKEDAINAFAPHKSFKHLPEIMAKRGKNRYRGYKGVGLTFLAYGSDDIVLHTKDKQGELTRTRMQYGRKWAIEGTNTAPHLTEDLTNNPLEKLNRGTFVKIQLSPQTRPRKLSAIATQLKAWETILRTRTAIGQISLFDEPLLSNISIELIVTDNNNLSETKKISPDFLLPHLAKDNPAFRFLDVVDFHERHETTEIPLESTRQDAIYLSWDKDRLWNEFIGEKEEFKEFFDNNNPTLYAFFPYNRSLWDRINTALTETNSRRYLSPGIIIGVNGQRLADIFEHDAKRYTNLAERLFVLIHYDNAKPDQGRKSIQDELQRLAIRASNSVLQYLAKQRGFLKLPENASTAGQRETERNHSDWLLNVQIHSRNSPLEIEKVTYKSEPLQEQDVIGLFNQLSSRGLFPGLKIFATSQSQTYDSLVEFNCPVETTGLQYKSADDCPIGITPHVLGSGKAFITPPLTLEFKSNLDGLIDEVGDTPNNSRKNFTKIDICVCWSVVSNEFKGFLLEEIVEQNADLREYPGVTHLLRKG